MKRLLGIILGVTGGLLVAGSAVWKLRNQSAITIIGGVDGPTSVFVAGKIGSDSLCVILGCGVALLILAGILWFCGKSKK